MNAQGFCSNKYWESTRLIYQTLMKMEAPQYLLPPTIDVNLSILNLNKPISCISSDRAICLPPTASRRRDLGRRFREVNNAHT